MTKKFDVVSLDGFIYLVDKEAEEKGKWEIIEGQLNLLSDDVDREGFLVIASNNPSVDVPQIRLLEEDMEKVKDLCYHQFGYTKSTMSNAHVGGNILEGFLAGYKAAKAKKYDEKDIEKTLYELAHNISYLVRNSNKEALYFNHEVDKALRYLKSLTKPIKSITIEMEERQFSYSGAFKAAMDAGEDMSPKPKLDKDGKVIIKEVEYYE